MITEKAIILRVRKFGEADLIVHALTQKGDKLQLFARSALKSRKRFSGGVLEPTHYVSLVYKPRRQEELYALTEANLINSFDFLRHDYDKLQLALYFVGLIDRLGIEGSGDSQEIFDLLGNSLRVLEKAQQLEVIRTQFELKLLYLQGVLPPIKEASQLLSVAMRDTAQVEISIETIRSLRVQTQNLLDQYLQ